MGALPKSAAGYNQLRSLGIADRSEIAVGQVADFVLLDDSLSPRLTIVGGSANCPPEGKGELAPTVFLSPFSHGHSRAFAEHPLYERIGIIATVGDYCCNRHFGVSKQLAGLLKAHVVDLVEYRPACGFLEFQCRHAS